MPGSIAPVTEQRTRATQTHLLSYIRFRVHSPPRHSLASPLSRRGDTNIFFLGAPPTLLQQSGWGCPSTILWVTHTLPYSYAPTREGGVSRPPHSQLGLLDRVHTRVRLQVIPTPRRRDHHSGCRQAVYIVTRTHSRGQRPEARYQSLPPTQKVSGSRVLLEF